MYHNQITELPNEIAELSQLQLLNLGDNRLTQLPKTFSKLTNLQKLYLFNNLFSEFPQTVLMLTNLQILVLYENSLSKIPIEISMLTNLQLLNLDDNHLTYLPKEITTLHLDIYLENYNIEKGITLSNNPLEIPPLEIVRQGKPAINEYFKSLDGERLPLNEVKVLLIGDGGAGKTSLAKRLLGKKFNYNETQTHGINIEDWNIKDGDTDIKVRFWDFGGQEIMHATHQFFLSKRSLYILVLDGRKDAKTEYWLKHIESFGGKSPILIIMNKIDEHPAFDVNRLFLQQKYKGIQGFFRLSCATNEGIESFSQSFLTNISNMELLKTTWSRNWFNVKTKLEAMKIGYKKVNYISYDEYREICYKQGVIEESSQNTLVDFLHDLGIILNFKDFKLEHTHVLEPRWVTEAVYRIINSELLSKSNGVLQLQFLEKILQQKKGKTKQTFFDKVMRREEYMGYEYPREKYQYIINLMEKFELCYEMDSETLLIPDLLEIQEPTFEFDYVSSLKFRFRYDFLPKSIMPRFIVKRHKDIKGNLRWRTGVVLEDSTFDSTAVMKADEREQTIYIHVNGRQKRDYFSVIRKTFRDIHETFERLDVSELVPLPDHSNITVDYKELLGLEKMGKHFIPIGKLGKEYRVKALLNGIEKEVDRLKKNGYQVINVQGHYYEHSKMEIDTMGNKHIGRDSIEISGNATVTESQIGGGDLFQGNYAQKLLKSTSPQSSQEEIIKLLSFVQQELPKLQLTEDIKEEVVNEVKGAEIQAKKEDPNKKKIAGKLKNATEVLKEIPKTVNEVVIIGNLLGKAIEWCEEQWIKWMI